MQLHAQLNILTQPIWLNFLHKALLSSYSVICSPWQPLSAIESPVKGKLPTTNLPWKAHLYHKIDSNPSEILRTSTSKLSSLDSGHAARIIDDNVFNLACAQIVLIVLLSLLSTYPTPTVLLEYTKLQLSCIDCYCCLHACEHVVKYGNSYIQCTWGSCNHTETSAR